MHNLFLLAFVAGILLGVRLLFFGAERRKGPATAETVRRWETALIGFLTAFGLAGYLLTSALVGAGSASLAALAFGAASAFVATRVATAAAHLIPEHDADDPRFLFQGHVAVVSSPILPDGEGEIRVQNHQGSAPLRARHIEPGGIAAGEEVCIERIEAGIAFVERWSLVEKRL